MKPENIMISIALFSIGGMFFSVALFVFLSKYDGIFLVMIPFAVVFFGWIGIRWLSRIEKALKTR